MTYSDPEGGNEQTVEYEPYSAEDRIHWFDDIVLENPTCRFSYTIEFYDEGGQQVGTASGGPFTFYTLNIFLEASNKVKVDAWWCVSMDADYHYEGTIEDGEEYYILLNLNPYFGYTVSRRTKIVMNREGNYYGFTRNVSSIQMADTITATFHYGPGWTVTNSYSVADYVQDFEEEKEDHNDATVNLVYALADYGHFVQPMLANARGWVPGKDHAVMPGHTESYSDDEITNATEAVSRFAAKFNAAGSSINVTSMYLALDSSTTLVLKLTPADGYMGDVTYSVDGGTPENAAVLDDGRFKITLPDITAPRLGQAYSIRIQASGEDSLEVSPLSYADTVLKSEKYSNDEDMRNAIVALYYYYSAAQGF